MKAVLVTAAVVLVGMVAFSLAGCTATGKVLGPAAVTVYDKKAERLEPD